MLVPLKSNGSCTVGGLNVERKGRVVTDEHVLEGGRLVVSVRHGGDALLA